MNMERQRQLAEIGSDLAHMFEFIRVARNGMESLSGKVARDAYLLLGDGLHYLANAMSISDPEVQRKFLEVMESLHRKGLGWRVH